MRLNKKARILSAWAIGIVLFALILISGKIGAQESNLTENLTLNIEMQEINLSENITLNDSLQNNSEETINSENSSAAPDFAIEQALQDNGGELGIQTDINGCQAITVSGVYTLTANVTNSALKHCIRINISDVVFEGQGFTIDGTDGTASFGIYAENRTSSLTNITITNVSVTDWTNGIYINNTLSGAVLNTTMRSNTQGLKIVDSTTLNISGNNFISNTYGIFARNISQILFDLNNFTSNTNTGMDIWRAANNNITNNNVSLSSQWDLRIRNSNNTLIDNNFLSSPSATYGLDLSLSSNYSTITNNIANSQANGFFISSGYNNVSNNSARGNSNGIRINYALYNNISNNTIQESTVYDILLDISNSGGCDNIINNNIGSGNRSILYFNGSVTAQDQNISEMILCNADNSNIININISGSMDNQNNGLFAYYTDNSNFTRIISSNNYYGLLFTNSYNNTIANSTANNNNVDGIRLSTSSNNIISESNMQYNWVEGISLGGSDNNILSHNVLKYNLDDGILIQTSSWNNTVFNNTANYNDEDGIMLTTGANNNTIVNNTANYNNQTGIDLFGDSSNAGPANNTVEYNIALNNTFYGLRLAAAKNNTIKGNYLINNTDTGMYINAEDPGYYPDTIPYNNLIINNTINSNSFYGLYMFSALNNTIMNNTINWNGDAGIYSTMIEYVGAEQASGSPNNLIVSNLINYNLYGVYLEQYNDNQFYSNVIDSNTISGIELINSNNNSFVNNTARNNTVWDVNLSGYYKNTFINLTIGPIISFTAHNISLKNATGSLPANPGSYLNINKYINISNISANAWIFLNISYTDSEIGALDESTFIIARHNGSWETTTSRFANPSGVITGLNYVFANITEIGNHSSIFAPLGQTASEGTAPIQVTNCTEINISGTYILMNNITNSPLIHCIRINVSEVVFEGQGYTIDGKDTSNSLGVYLENRTISLTNVTVQNVSLTDWATAVYINNTLSGAIKNITATSNLNYGIKIIDSANINITGNNLPTNLDYGIFGNNVSKSVIDQNNISSTSSLTDGGLYITNLKSSNITNNNISRNDGIGIYLNISNYNIIDKNIANSNLAYGISTRDSNHSTITKNTINDHNQAGIYIMRGHYNNISNNTIQENQLYDIDMNIWRRDSEISCENTITNNIGSGNRPILYFNYSMTLQDQNLSQLILCNADNSILENITISGSNTILNNGMAVYFTDNSNFSNITSSNNYVGTDFEMSQNNVLTNFTTYTNYNFGIYLLRVNNSKVSYIYAENNFDGGIWLEKANHNNISNNVATNNTNYGLYLVATSDNNTFFYNNVSNNPYQGISIEEGYNNTFSYNTVNNNSYDGFIIGWGSNNTVSHNIINNNDYGLELYAWRNYIFNNTINNNAAYGLYMDYFSDNNTIDNNTINFNLNGVYLKRSNNSLFNNNNIESNTRHGIYLERSNNNSFVNNIARNNTVWDVNVSKYNENTFTNLTIGPVISFKLSNVAIKNASSPAADPNNFQNISKWVNATNTTANAWLFLNISYTNSEITGLDESSFIIGRYNGTWENTTAVFANPSGVIVANNYVFANMTSFSIFAPLGQTAGADSTAPVSKLDSPSNNTFSASTLVAFNCSVTDNVGLSNLTLFSNTNGSWSENLTYAISGTSNQTNITVNGIADGTYIWNCLVKDTSNNQAFNSTNYTFTVDQTPPYDVTLNAPAEAYSSTDTSVNFSFSVTDNLDANITCNLTIDSVVTNSVGVSNGTSASIIRTIDAGSHQWNVTCYDDALNSNYSITRNFTITSSPSNPPSGGGGSSGGGGGGGLTKQPEPLPPAVLPPQAPVAEPELPEPVLQMPELPPLEPIAGNALSGIINSILPVSVAVQGRRIDEGFEVLFGGKAKIKITTDNKKPTITIDFGEDEYRLMLPELPKPIFASGFLLLLLLLITLLTYGTVHATYDRIAPAIFLTKFKRGTIKNIKKEIRRAGKKPKQKNLDKIMEIFSKYTAAELEIPVATHKKLIDAIEGREKFKNEIREMYSQFSHTSSDNIERKEFKKFCREVISIVRKL